MAEQNVHEATSFFEKLTYVLDYIWIVGVAAVGYFIKKVRLVTELEHRVSTVEKDVERCVDNSRELEGSIRDLSSCTMARFDKLRDEFREDLKEMIHLLKKD